MNTPQTWTLLKSFKPEGHAFFERGGVVAVVDNSGARPGETDDDRRSGVVLQLDRDSRARIGRGMMALPTLQGANKAWTPALPEEIAWAAATGLVQGIELGSGAGDKTWTHLMPVTLVDDAIDKAVSAVRMVCAGGVTVTLRTTRDDGGGLPLVKIDADEDTVLEHMGWPLFVVRVNESIVWSSSIVEAIEKMRGALILDGAEPGEILDRAARALAQDKEAFFMREAKRWSPAAGVVTSPAQEIERLVDGVVNPSDKRGTRRRALAAAREHLFRASQELVDAAAPESIASPIDIALAELSGLMRSEERVNSAGRTTVVNGKAHLSYGAMREAASSPSSASSPSKAQRIETARKLTKKIVADVAFVAPEMEKQWLRPRVADVARVACDSDAVAEIFLVGLEMRGSLTASAIEDELVRFIDDQDHDLPF